MTFEILNYRRRWSAVTRDSTGGVIAWSSRTYATEAEVREAIQRLAETDWAKTEIVLSRY